MEYLLDTVAFLHSLKGSLPPKLRRRLQNPQAALFVSIVTPWEIAIKRTLRDQGLTNDVVEEQIRELGARLVPITIEHTGLLAALPAFDDHRDPFDRMLIVQAIDAGFELVSNDRRFSRYASCGLRTIWESPQR